MLGKRKSYLHPIRMYVFTSAMFFLLFFTFFQPKEQEKQDPNAPMDKQARSDLISRFETKLKKDSTDAAVRNTLIWLKDTSSVVTIMDGTKMDNDGDQDIISFSGRDYASFLEYDSLQHRLPANKRDGWFMRLLVRREIDLNNKYRGNKDGALHSFKESALHKLPYMLFVSLPLFALLLKLVYIRRKQFFYADHGIFTIHLYVFTFLMLLLIFFTGKIQEVTGQILEFVVLILYLLLYFYLYKAMRNFYGQRRAKTILKFLLISFFSLIMFLILLIFFLLFSALTF